MTNYDLFTIFMAVLLAALAGYGFWIKHKLRQMDRLEARLEARRDVNAAE